jgi:hypothetical protein
LPDKKTKTAEVLQVKKIELGIGDVVQLKKQHPCGSYQWEIYRTGMDFGIKCLGCGRKVMIPRRKIEKSVKAVIKKGSESGSSQA